MSLIEAARAFAIAEIEKYGLPAMDHFAISEAKAIEVARKLGADEMIVTVWHALCDIKLGQAFQENRLHEHVAMWVEATKEFLQGFDLDDSTKEKIINCVAAHHAKIPFGSLEAEIVANSDCYRFIHPKGFFVFLTVLGKRFNTFEQALDRAEEKMDEKYGILSLDVCKEELEEYYQTLKRYIADARK